MKLREAEKSQKRLKSTRKEAAHYWRINEWAKPGDKRGFFVLGNVLTKHGSLI